MSDELLAASAAGDGDTVTKLLQEGVSVNSRDEMGFTGLHVGAQEGHDDIVKIFLDHEADVNIRGWNNKTPLMWAANSGHLSIARLLISYGADLELRDDDGKTALKAAAQNNYPDIVSEILSRGAQEYVTDNRNDTALQTAEHFGCYDVMKIFAAWHDSESRDNKLFEASSEGKTRLTRGLLIAGSSHEFRNAGEDQAIHIAAQAGHTDVVRVLAESGG